ncbi:MAG TPA: hypothetical protein P5292_06545, partial [Bacteroidia bacterium]|nr:hypothetical protein [Bacteroidia bacterium]
MSRLLHRARLLFIDGISVVCRLSGCIRRSVGNSIGWSNCRLRIVCDPCPVCCSLNRIGIPLTSGLLGFRRTNGFLPFG